MVRDVSEIPEVPVNVHVPWASADDCRTEPGVKGKPNCSWGRDERGGLGLMFLSFIRYYDVVCYPNPITVKIYLEIY